MYREQQEGGLCRMHAINAFFSKRKYTRAQFQGLLSEFKQYLKDSGFSGHCDVDSYDLFHESRETIMSYALKRNGIFSTLVPIRHIQKRTDWASLARDFVFVFNQSHVWGVRLGHDGWYLIDSMRPIQRLGCLNAYAKSLGDQHGMVIPRHRHDAIDEFGRHVDMAHSIIDSGLEAYCTKMSGLGDLDSYLSIAAETLQYAYGDFSREIQIFKQVRSKWNVNRGCLNVVFKDIEDLVHMFYGIKSDVLKKDLK